MSEWKAGDIGFSRGKDIMAAAIRFAERRDGEPDEFNHVFMLDHLDDNQEWVVIQAQLRGVTDTCRLSEVSPGGVIEVVPFPDADADRARFVEFMRAQVGDEYSLMAIASNVFDMVLPDIICLRRANTWICSGLVAGGLLYAGYAPIINIPDLYTITPGAIQVLLNA